MDRTAQALEIAKCLDALPLSWWENRLESDGISLLCVRSLDG